MPDHPFDASEIEAALRLLGVPPDEACEAAAELAAPREADVELQPRATPPAAPPEGVPLAFESVPTVQFLGDFLALLSLTSRSTRRKVAEYRAQLSRRGELDHNEEEAWHTRRDELARLLDVPEPDDEEAR